MGEAPRSHRSPGRLCRAAWGVLLGLLAAGCGGRGDVAHTDDDTLAAAAPPLATMALADTVQVSLVEYGVEMPAALGEGPTVFEVTNNGTAPHNFQVEGQGIRQAFPNLLPPGATQALQVDLRPGTYEVYCPADDHRQQGMALRLAVTGTGTAADTTAIDTTAADTTAMP